MKSNKYKIVTGTTNNITISPLGLTFKNSGGINLVVEEGNGCNITNDEIDAVIEALVEVKRVYIEGDNSG